MSDGQASQKQPPESSGILERLVCTVGGAALGAVVVVILTVANAIHRYQVVGVGYAVAHPLAHSDLLFEIKIGAIVGAILGFVFKERVADFARAIAGAKIDTIQQYDRDTRERGARDMPGWLVMLVAIFGMGVIIYVVHMH